MNENSAAPERLSARFYRQMFALGTVVVLFMYSVADALVFAGCRGQL